MYLLPINILIVLNNFNLNGFLRDLIFDTFLFKIIYNRLDSLMQTSGCIEKIDPSADLLNLSKSFFKTGNRIKVDLYFINGSIIDADHSALLQCIHNLGEQRGGNLILIAEGVNLHDFLLVFFSVEFADSVTIKQFVINGVRVKPFLRLLFPFSRFFDHIHNYSPETVQSDKFRGDKVAIVMVVLQ